MNYVRKKVKGSIMYKINYCKNWMKIPTRFKTNLDGAYVRTSNGEIYFFKNNEYLRYTKGKGMDSGCPKNIRTGWPGVLLW